MKGISTIIAAIILVVITIGLIATAYLYFAGIVSVGPVVAIANAYCNETNHIKISLRNDGTSQLDTGDLTWIRNGTKMLTGYSCDKPTVNAGDTTNCVLDAGGSGLKDIKIIGPRNQAGGPVTC